MSSWRKSDCMKQVWKNHTRVEVFRSDGSGISRMTTVVAVDSFDCRYRFVRSTKTKQPVTAWQIILKSRVLGNDRSPAGQIAHAAITEPSATRYDIAALGNSEFGFRLPNECLVLLGGRHQRRRVH